MIYGFTVENYLGKSLKFTLSDGTPAHGLIVKEITGLGPPKATINTTDYATEDGGQFNSARAEKRTITITFKIVGNYNEQIGAVEYSRDLTYQYFPLKKRVHLIFDQFDHRSADIYGYVESNEPNIFSDDEEATISIVCDDPYFYKYGLGAIQTTRFSATDSLFEFEFENPTEDKKIEFSELAVKRERVVDYEGDVEVGVTMTINVRYPHVGDIKIYNLDTAEEMTIYIDKILAIADIPNLDYGDEIVISTISKQHSAIFTSKGKVYNIINAIDRHSSWFRLRHGQNVFIYSAEEDTENNVYFLIENRVVYEGV